MPKHLLFIIAALVVCAPRLTSSQASTCDTPPDGGRYGVTDNLSWRFVYHDTAELNRAMDMMNAAGIGWVRLNWSWKDMQQPDGTWIFDRFDEVAALAGTHDLELLPILMTIPEWASSAPQEMKDQYGGQAPVDRYRPADINLWLNYVRTVVERYDGDGVDDAPGSPRLTYWEVWNEENLTLFWPPVPNAAEYVGFLAATHDAVLEADPTAKVVLGGLAGHGINAEGTGFLQQIYDNGGGDYFDVVSVHLYTHPYLGSVDQIQAALNAARREMDARGDEDKELWLTETGWSDAPLAWAQPTATSEQIGDFLTRLYTTPLPADKIFWYNFRNIYDDNTEVEHHFGLIRYDWTPKPSYLALQAVACG
jgi:polysaccharide biosynthesis protein PslG